MGNLKLLISILFMIGHVIGISNFRVLNYLHYLTLTLVLARILQMYQDPNLDIITFQIFESSTSDFCAGISNDIFTSTFLPIF